VEYRTIRAGSFGIGVAMDDADEKPWNESQWEQFMKRADMRAARFGELLETLRENPDCDMVISREMGWEDAEQNDSDTTEDEDGCDAEENEPLFDVDALNTASLEAAEEPIEEEPVETVEAYHLASTAAEQIDQSLRPFLKGAERENAGDEAGELLAQTCINMHIATVKIARGHGMGYDDDVLCGNIVCCRIAFDAAGRCRDALLELRSKKILPIALIDSLLRLVSDAHQAIEQRIAELRSRVWW
jgi:hypothetical protein